MTEKQPTVSGPRLTAADVMDLRTSLPSGLRSSGGGVNLSAPYILYLPADDAFCLHAYGSPQAKSADVGLLAECLRQERAEPGFIRRILDPREDVFMAALDPASRASAVAARNLDASRARAYREEQDAASVRRASQLNLTKIGLEDL